MLHNLIKITYYYYDDNNLLIKQNLELEAIEESDDDESSIGSDMDIDGLDEILNKNQ